MPGKRRGHAFSCIDVPEADELVVGARGEDLGVGGPGYAGDAGEVAFEGLGEGAGGGVPDFDCAVGGCLESVVFSVLCVDVSSYSSLRSTFRLVRT